MCTGLCRSWVDSVIPSHDNLTFWLYTLAKVPTTTPITECVPGGSSARTCNGDEIFAIKYGPILFERYLSICGTVTDVISLHQLG